MTGAATIGTSRVFTSLRVRAREEQGVALRLDAACPFWSETEPIVLSQDAFGHTLPEDYRTEVRSRWTDEHLYFLFVSRFREMWCRPAPVLDRETPELWNWDVAEVFLQPWHWPVHRYREFEVSPQGEWIDVDVDLSDPPHERGWVWVSGMECRASIDEVGKTWTAALRVPMVSLDTPRPEAGLAFRANFFRTEGPESRTTAVAWQPPMSSRFHQPSAFGTLLLA